MQTIDKTKVKALFTPPSEHERSCVIRAVDVKKVYRMGDVETHALRGASLDVYRGEYLSIMGPSGSGKTTLLNIAGSLDVPSEGSATVLGRTVGALSHEAAAELRSRHFRSRPAERFTLIRWMWHSSITSSSRGCVAARSVISSSRIT